jgi:long-chain acyl-CoA synthetase
LEDKPWLAYYESHVPAEIEVPRYPIGENLVQAARDHPSGTAIIFGGTSASEDGLLLDTRLTYRRLLEDTTRAAAGLRTLGLRKGDRIAIHLGNCPQFVITYYASMMLGAIAVPCSTLYTTRELGHQLQDSGARILVTHDQAWSESRSLPAAPALTAVVLTNADAYLPARLRSLRGMNNAHPSHLAEVFRDLALYRFRDLLRADPFSLDRSNVHLDDTAALIYTGGTTGTPKGAELSHRNLQANVTQFRCWLHFLQRGRELIVASLPLYHSYGMTTCMNLAVLLASGLLLIQNPRQLNHMLASIREHRPTVYPGVPGVYMSLIDRQDIQQYNLASIKVCISGAAPLPAEVQRRFQELTGGRLVEGYGLTEASPVTHVNPIFAEPPRQGIGFPLPGTDARIVDPAPGTREMPPGSPGELVVRGPQVMKGYWRAPDETETAVRDGWLRTGDIAVMDRDGYFRIVDRMKDVILSTSGLPVYPREVEEILYQHPSVGECAVVGRSVGASGEQRVKAFVVLKHGEQTTADQLVEFCRENLASYKIPKEVVFRKGLPKSPIGKILRRALKDDIENDQSC